MSQQLSEKAKKRIEAVRQDKTTKLNLIGEGLVDVTFLKEFPQLTRLDLNSNQIVNLSPLSKLSCLTRLSLSQNQIVDIAPLSKLKSLNQLSLSSNPIIDISPLSSLFSLNRLYLSSSQISDISSLSNLKSLVEIYLSRNEIVDISPLSKLINLKTCSLSRNEIIDISPLSQMKQLIELDLSQNQIVDMSCLFNLTSLKIANLSQNKIVDILFLFSLVNLTSLDLSQNRISEMPDFLLQLKLPILWKESGFIIRKGIYLKDNPLLTPPPEIVQQGNEAIETFFMEINYTRPLNEVKVILVGEGAVGKTSIVNRLLNQDFNGQESQTQGINISQADFTYEKRNKLKIHFWDFGGQEIMHATHQFFLTKRCVYLLVLDSRKDQKIDYWLRHIENFGGDAPIIVVLNKQDENLGFDLNRQFLQNKYPNIIDFYKVSCKANTGIEQLKTALKKQLWDLELRQTTFPSAWWKVKKRLENMKKDFVSYQFYQELCQKNEIEKENIQKILLRFLNDLGIIFNYEQKLNWYDETQVLNPLWLTNAVYRIINSPIVAESNGRFCIQELGDIINDIRYKNLSNHKKFHVPKEKYRFIIAMMQSFELVYKMDDYNYIFSELLPVKQNLYSFATGAKILHFIVEYPDFLPTSILPRFMVRQHKYILDNKAWRTGMVLQESLIVHSIANVVLDKEKRQIHFHIAGERARDFLTILRNTLEEIHKSFENLEIQEWIPLPEPYKGEILLVEYQELIGYEVAKQPNYFSGKLRKSFVVQDLLNGIEHPEERQTRKYASCSIFVCYHSKDEAYKEALNKHLMPLVRLKKVELWDKSEINAGEKYKETIFNELDNADLVLCLISVDFINEDFCYSEQLNHALKLQANGSKKVAPIKIRSCRWQRLPLARQKALPEKSWVGVNPENDDVWTEVVEGIEKLIEEQWKGRWTK